jgi:Zn-dependent protease with chaperone function
MRISVLLMMVVGLLLSGCRTVVPAERLPRERAERLARVGERLGRVIPYPGAGGQWRFVVVRGWTPRAEADRSGVVRLTTGLLAFAETDELLAFALAHEMAHVALGDPGAQRMQDVLRLLGGAVAGWAVTGVTGDPGLGLASGAGFLAGSEVLLRRPGMREREHRADAVALRWCVQAGYAARCGERFWEAYAQARPVPENAAWLAKHPPDEDRRQRLAAEAQGLMPR